MLNYRETTLTRREIALPLWDTTTIDYNNRNRLPSNHLSIFEYFHEITKEGRTAKRSDLDPSKLVAYLPNIWLTDVVIDENNRLQDMVMRLMGTAIAAFYGEHTNRSLIKNPPSLETSPELVEPLKRFIEAVETIIVSKKPAFGKASAETNDRPLMEFSTLYIPFSDDGISVNMIFGYSEYRAMRLK